MMQKNCSSIVLLNIKTMNTSVKKQLRSTESDIGHSLRMREKLALFHNKNNRVCFIAMQLEDWLKLYGSK